MKSAFDSGGVSLRNGGGKGEIEGKRTLVEGGEEGGGRADIGGLRGRGCGYCVEGAVVLVKKDSTTALGSGVRALAI
jgi:hypothetical protein